MDRGHEEGSIVLETPDEIDIVFDAVDQMELDLAGGKVTGGDTERVTNLLSNVGGERIELSVEDSLVGLIGLELACGSGWANAKTKIGAGEMLNDYNRKRLQPR